jgi:hypothetical protein
VVFKGMRSASGRKESNKNLTVKNLRHNNVQLFQLVFTTGYKVVQGN